ncbi:MAG: hypothetical protein ACFNQA_02695 [Flavobacteriaceae bacterium]
MGIPVLDHIVIGDNEFTLLHQKPRYQNPLLLPSRKSIKTTVSIVLQFHFVQHFIYFF